MGSPLDYQEVKLPEDAVFKISPSGFGKFISRLHDWYRVAVLKEVLFEYSTATVLGTVVHYCAECAAQDIKPDIDVIEEYIYKHKEKEDYDPEIVQLHYRSMATALINGYVMEHKSNYIGVELQHCAEVKKGYYAGGSLDVLEGDIKYFKHL